MTTSLYKEIGDDANDNEVYKNTIKLRKDKKRLNGLVLTENN